MNNVLLIDTESSYHIAEQRARQYFSTLVEQVDSGRYEAKLMDDLQQWRSKHVRRQTWLSSFVHRYRMHRSKAQQMSYIEWLDKQGKLDAYLERSVAYIFLRDLGKKLDQPATAEKVKQVVQSVKGALKRTSNGNAGRQPHALSFDGAYRWGQKEGVESAVIWVIGKLKLVEQHMPAEMDAEHAVRKLIKIIVGVVMHAMDEMNDATPAQQRVQALDQAIRLGYCYGLTYPYIDDLLDSNALTNAEKLAYSNMLREALQTGVVPSLKQWSGINNDNLRFIHKELTEAFQYVKSVQREQNEQLFFQQAYVFFQAQEVDRRKEMSNTSYSNEELYIPIILKSASSRLVARSVLSGDEDEGFEHATFYYGIYNQLADDFADVFDDYKANAVTPYTYYLSHHQQRPDLINPFQLYWAVITHLLHGVYNGDERTRDVILGRAIGGLKRFKSKHGESKYNELMDVLAGKHSQLRGVITALVERADDVDFLDKLLRDQLITSLREEQVRKEQFSEKIKLARKQINEALLLENDQDIPHMRKLLIGAANYSLEGGGKRLRPVMAWIMGVEQYQLSPEALMPLLRSLEYMHTASLIIDDLPTQDNADSRRGRPTLHTIHNSATAELTSLLLIQRAFHEQSSLQQFDAKAVLAMMRYSSQKAEELCIGQAMDLDAKGKQLTLEQLNDICFYKTAIAFEAALVMPAILAGAPEEEIAALKSYAYHAGIAFQIRDDLLDYSGDASLMGKPVGLDAVNNTSTFVTVLGEEGAQQAMWNHYCYAADVLNGLKLRTSFLNHLLNYIVHRNY